MKPFRVSGHLGLGLEMEEEGLPHGEGSLGQGPSVYLNASRYIQPPDLFSLPSLLRAGAALVPVLSAAAWLELAAEHQ